MNGRVVDFSRSAHRHARELLPWYLTGRLDEDQRLAVEAHLRTCTACQQALQWERELQASLAGAPISRAWNADAGFALLRERLDAPATPWERARRQARAALSLVLDSSPRWLGYAALAQLAIITVLAWNVYDRSGTAADYRTLGAAPAAAASANILVVFDSNSRERDLERILRSVGARIVGGPNEAGGYLLAVDPGMQALAVDKLRAEKAVRLAEPLKLGASP